MTQPLDIKTALILQGGGALGAYEFGVFKRLHEETNFNPKIFAGISIGAFTAAAIVGGKHGPIGTLEKLWEKMSIPSFPLIPDILARYLSIYGNSHMYHPRYDYINFWSWTNWYDTTPLKRLLEDLVDFKKINCEENEKQLIVAATNVRTGKIEFFSNKLCSSNNDKMGPHSPGLTSAHIMASGSIPPLYPMTQIGAEYYWDGALYSNSPLSTIFAGHCNHNMCIVAFVIDLFESSGHIPKNIFNVYDRIIQIWLQNKFTFGIEGRKIMLEHMETILDIDKKLPDDSPIRDMPGYIRMKMAANICPITIKPSEPEGLVDVNDYSERAIKRRIDTGYSDADRKLREILDLITTLEKEKPGWSHYDFVKVLPN